MPTPVSNYKRIETEAVVKEEITFYERKQRRRSMSVDAKMQTTKNTTDTVNHHFAESVENIENFSDTGKFNQNKFYKNLGKKSSSVSSLYNTIHKKYVSTAEAIYHLQKDTPERFHSYSKKKEFQWLDASRKKTQLHSTIPHSPALLSKTRNRPTAVLSQKQIEELELEEIKKYKIKAQPIPQFVCRLAPVQRRPVTRPEPFNLTEIRKKLPVNNSPDKGFVARPMPKQIYTSAPVLNKKQIPITIPKSPNITKTQKSLSLDHVAFGMVSSMKHKHIKYEGHTGVPLTEKKLIQSVKPQPFSFEEKDKERQQRKLEKIQKVLEEEKKLREFHAKPIPAILKKSKMNSSHSPKSCNSAENKENKPNNVNCPAFKARPAIVLSKKPFVPIHKDKVLTEPCQVKLTTEQRAKEREMYDLKMKEKEEIFENMRRQREEEEKRREEKEVLALRATLVHKAAPIKQYAPIAIHPSNVELTTAKSPKFSHK